MKDIFRLLLDVDLYRDLALIVVPVTAAAVVYLWYRAHGFGNMMSDVIKFGVYCSVHQTINAGERDDYFDSDIYLSEPKNVGSVLHWFGEEINKERSTHGRVDRLAFIEKEDGPVGALTLKDLLTWQSRIPSVLVRPGRWGPALRVKFFHEGLVRTTSAANRLASKGHPENVLLISDVLTTGKTILQSVDLIERNGGRVNVAFVLYDRQEKIPSEGGTLSANDILARRGIRLVSMVKAAEIQQAAACNAGLRKIAKDKGLACQV